MNKGIAKILRLALEADDVVKKDTFIQSALVFLEEKQALYVEPLNEQKNEFDFIKKSKDYIFPSTATFYSDSNTRA